MNQGYHAGLKSPKSAISRSMKLSALADSGVDNEEDRGS